MKQRETVIYTDSLQNKEIKLDKKVFEGYLKKLMGEGITNMSMLANPEGGLTIMYETAYSKGVITLNDQNEKKSE